MYVGNQHAVIYPLQSAAEGAVSSAGPRTAYLLSQLCRMQTYTKISEVYGCANQG